MLIPHTAKRWIAEMSKFLEIVIILAILSLVLASLKLAYGQDWLTEHGNDSITGTPSMEQIIKNAQNMSHKNVTTDITKVGAENLKLINRLTMVLNSCTQIITSGDSSPVCDKFQRLENKYLRQLFNETRPDVEKILLD
jgi:hypothetical protein